MPRTILGGLFILRHASEGFTGFAEFYDIVARHKLPRGDHQFWTHDFVELFRGYETECDSFFAQGRTVLMGGLRDFGGIVIADGRCERCYQHEGTAHEVRDTVFIGCDTDDAFIRKAARAIGE